MAEIDPQLVEDPTTDYETAYIRDLDPNPSPNALDLLATEASSQAGYKTTFAQIGNVVNGVTGVCTETAANVKDKIVVLSNYEATIMPREFDVTFTYGNEYGDTTAATPTYPTLYVYNKNGKDFLGQIAVGDSRGHYAGAGCWKDGDTMAFRIMNDKACIQNSDVRQATSEYTIMSDGTIEEWGVIIRNELTYNFTSSGMYGKLLVFKKINNLKVINAIPIGQSSWHSTCEIIGSKGSNSINIFVEGYNDIMWYAKGSL